MRLTKKSKSGHIFCNQSCAAKYTNTHKTWGTRRSKLEGWLEEKLRELYPELDIHCNRTDAIQGELDFYFPGLKLAFELNGIFHYEPIYGTERLGKTQSNDARKFAACTERGIELCILDTSRMKYFKVKWAQDHLKVIQEVLDRVIAQRVGAGWGIQSTDPTRGRSPVVLNEMDREMRGERKNPSPKGKSPKKIRVERKMRFGATKLLEKALQWGLEMNANGWNQSDLARHLKIHVSIVARTMTVLRVGDEMKKKLLERDPEVGHTTTKELIGMARAR